MAYNTIKLKKYVDIVNELKAGETISPGHLVEQYATGLVKKHATAGGNVLPMFALEDELRGNDVDDNYASGDQVQVWCPVRGEEVYAVLADGQSVVEGDFLTSNGDGTLKKHSNESWESADAQQANTIYACPIVGVALERKDLTGSSGEDSAGESSVSPLGYDKRIAIRVY